MNPIGVGFLELDPEGLFHHQRLQLRPDFRCVKSRAVQCGRAGSAIAASKSRTDDSRELSSEPEISLVWVGSSASPADVQSALDAGNHVLCGLPLGGSLAEWRRLLQPQLRVNSRRIFVATLHRWDSLFRTVRSQIDNGDLGTVVSLRRISRQFVPGELSQRPQLTAGGEHQVQSQTGASRTFELKWFEFLDELLLLVPQPIRSVWAERTGTGRSVWVTLADGCQAHLELNQRSLAPLETGWIVEGMRGGFAAGRRYRAEADFELVDVPVDVLPTDQEAFYNSLIATIRDEAPFPVTYESIIRVLELRDAIETSLRTGAVVDVAGD